jgi:hypothetical protein
MVNKTRAEKLSDSISQELKSGNPKLHMILAFINTYEANNLKTIDKLNRVKVVTLKKISGALKGCINSHGPITKVLIGSATKRVYGSLLSESTNKSYNFISSIRNKILSLWGRK